MVLFIQIQCELVVIDLTKQLLIMCAEITVVLIGDATAERIKHELGCAYPGNEIKEMEVRGRNLAEGIPRSFTLNSNEILEALQEPLTGIVGAVKNALEKTPPELGSDVAERGLVLRVVVLY